MVEIGPEDIIARPENLPVVKAVAEAGAAGNPGGFNPADIIRTIKQYKGYLDQLRELTGGRLDQIFPGLAALDQGGQGAAELKDSPPQQQNPAMGFILLIHALQSKYGDLTVKELLARLETEYGNTRLSKILGGK